MQNEDIIKEITNVKCWMSYRAMQWRTLEGVTSDARPSLMFNGHYWGKSSHKVLGPEIETSRVNDNYISRIFTARAFAHSENWKNISWHVHDIMVYFMFLKVYHDVFSERRWLGRLTGPWIKAYSDFWSPSQDSCKLYYITAINEENLYSKGPCFHTVTLEAPQ